jgi:hypothetical protein
MDFLALAYQKGTGLLHGTMLFVAIYLLDSNSRLVVIAVVRLRRAVLLTCIVLSRVLVTNNAGSGLDERVYLLPIHTTSNYT